MLSQWKRVQMMLEIMLNSRNVYPLWLIGVTLIFVTIRANLINYAALCYLILKNLGFIFSISTSARFLFPQQFFEWSRTFFKQVCKWWQFFTAVHEDAEGKIQQCVWLVSQRLYLQIWWYSCLWYPKNCGHFRSRALKEVIKAAMLDY